VISASTTADRYIIKEELRDLCASGGTGTKSSIGHPIRFLPSARSRRLVGDDVPDAEVEHVSVFAVANEAAAATVRCRATRDGGLRREGVPARIARWRRRRGTAARHELRVLSDFVRIGSAEREAAQHALHAHLSSGRLGVPEYASRHAWTVRSGFAPATSAEQDRPSDYVTPRHPPVGRDVHE
jgi:hypothetical protein